MKGMNQNAFTNDSALKRHLKILPEEVVNYYDTFPLENTDRLAYMQYATNYDYLNLAILNFVELRNAKTQIPNLVILFDEILQYYSSNVWNQLYLVANHYNITLRSTPLLKTNYMDDSPWAASFTKLHVFNQDDFERIVFFDSDSMFVNASIKGGAIDPVGRNCHIDELFKLPQELTLALPQAYWLNNVVEGKAPPLKYKQKFEIPDERRQRLKMKKLVYDLSTTNNWQMLPSLLYDSHKFSNVDNFFANHIMVVKPSKRLFTKIMKYVYNPWYWRFTNRKNLRKSSDYDMEILNKFLDTELHKGHLNVGILPHRVYGVLTGEFREEWHGRFTAEPQYLPFVKKQSNKGWNPMQILSKIKLVHFSDSPIPKPWEEHEKEYPYNTKKIFCKSWNMTEYNIKYPNYKPRLVEDCESVEIWNWFRTQFEVSRKDLWYAG
ncbi:GNT1 [Candida oxycetoniae]|uniref:GNT1 n=1 Tax=Candida oxycetoniae TaxID=497107 RepID=A0AAI9WZB8_9ASCO|nr:GNT1 [Candida oxycetoniae]KAI3405740.2 GNT1 [Candida oxycetoniae]